MSPRKLPGPCSVNGCPGLGTHAGRCDAHRLTTGQRDYGSQHQAERAAWQRRIDKGGVRCRRCNRLIPPRDPSVWDLGHPAPKRPECRGRCNRSTMGRDRS